MTNEELAQAIEETDKRVRQCGTGQPRYHPLLEHLKALLAEQLRRAQAPTATASPASVTMDDNDRLKPCPFCGAEADIISIAGETDAINTGAQCVQCTSSACGASSALIYPLMNDVTHLLIERWNKRYTSQ